jgi:hypothetical protein
MSFRMLGFAPLFAAIVLAAVTGLNRPCEAATQTVTASIKFVTPGVVNKSADISFPPLPSAADIVATVFMDAHGMTWVQQGDIMQGRQGQTGVITIDDSGSQLINFITGNLSLNPGLEPLRVICSMHTNLGDDCKNLLAPSSPGKKKTVYIAMNILVDELGKSGGAAGGPSSIDIAVVYQ